MAGFKIWGTGPSALAVEVVAYAGGTAVETPFFTMDVTNKTPDYLASISADGQVGNPCEIICPAERCPGVEQGPGW
jgi:hypothetical protein